MFAVCNWLAACGALHFFSTFLVSCRAIAVQLLNGRARLTPLIYIYLVRNALHGEVNLRNPINLAPNNICSNARNRD